MSNYAIESDILQNQANWLSDELTELKGYSQRHNLLFDGIKEISNDNCKITIDEIAHVYVVVNL